MAIVERSSHPTKHTVTLISRFLARKTHVINKINRKYKTEIRFITWVGNPFKNSPRRRNPRLPVIPRKIVSDVIAHGPFILRIQTILFTNEQKKQINYKFSVLI